MSEPQDFSAWVGRTETVSEDISAARAGQLAAEILHPLQRAMFKRFQNVLLFPIQVRSTHRFHLCTTGLPCGWG